MNVIGLKISDVLTAELQIKSKKLPENVSEYP